MKSMRKLNLVWVMFSMILSRQQAWQPDISASECSKGTRVSFCPWMISTGQLISLQFYSLLKVYFRIISAHPPQRSFAIFFRERKGLRRMAQWIGCFWVRERPTAQPMDLPKTIIWLGANLLASRKETTLSASAWMWVEEVAPQQMLYPRYSIARIGQLVYTLTILRNSCAEVMSSPLAWKKSMILGFVPFRKRQGMYSLLLTFSLVLRLPSRVRQNSWFLSASVHRDRGLLLPALSLWIQSRQSVNSSSCTMRSLQQWARQLRWRLLCGSCGIRMIFFCDRERDTLMAARLQLLGEGKMMQLASIGLALKVIIIVTYQQFYVSYQLQDDFIEGNGSGHSGLGWVICRSSLIISTICMISLSNSALAIFPSPFSSRAVTRLSMSVKVGSSTWKAMAMRLMSCPNSFFSRQPELSTSNMRKAALSSRLAMPIITYSSIRIIQINQQELMPSSVQLIICIVIIGYDRSQFKQWIRHQCKTLAFRLYRCFSQLSRDNQKRGCAYRSCMLLGRIQAKRAVALATMFFSFINNMNSAKQPNVIAAKQPPKQAVVKLIPIEPTTNTILIIFCSSPTGGALPYKSVWRRIHPKKNRVEDIKNHNVNSYRCSPLDLDCTIEATVFYQLQNVQMSKQVQTNIVKVVRELKERRILTKDPIPCRVSIDDAAVELQFLVQEGSLVIMPKGTQPPPFVVALSDIMPETGFDPNTFRMYFKNRFEEFFSYFSLVLGGRPQVKSQCFVCIFAGDISRDIVLLGIAENGRQVQTTTQPTLNMHKSNPFRFQTSNLHSAQQRIKTQMRPLQGPPTLLNHNKNRSEASLSPVHSQRSRVKIVEKANLSTSFSNLNKQKKSESLHNNSSNALRGVAEKPYLNVFEEQEEEEVVVDQSISMPKSNTANISNSVNTSQDQPSINLRGSFEQLERSFSNVNEQAIDKALGFDSKAKRYQEQIEALKKQNEVLKKQGEAVAVLTKQNNGMKRKYHELKEEINRLQLERKVILTDKLRCEVNWHKEIQEKEGYKREVEHLRELLKNAINNGLAQQERSRKNSNGYEALGSDRVAENRERTRSPNASFYNR